MIQLVNLKLIWIELFKTTCPTSFRRRKYDVGRDLSTFTCGTEPTNQRRRSLGIIPNSRPGHSQNATLFTFTTTMSFWALTNVFSSEKLAEPTKVSTIFGTNDLYGDVSFSPTATFSRKLFLAFRLNMNNLLTSHVSSDPVECDTVLLLQHLSVKTFFGPLTCLKLKKWFLKL